jgi:hypothetical protein
MRQLPARSMYLEPCWKYWVREAWTFMVQSNQPQKVFVVERIRHTHRVGKQATLIAMRQMSNLSLYAADVGRR